MATAASDEYRRGGSARSGGASDGRGRDAVTPTQIPARGWKDILYRVFKEVSNDRVTLVAAGTTFYLLLALAPTLAAFVSLYGLFLDPAEIAEQTAALSAVVPGGGMDILTGQLERLASAEQSTLGFAFALSLALALWSANSGIKSLFEAMNVAYDEVEKRGFVKLTLVSLAFTLCTLAAIIGLVVFNTAFTTFRESLGITFPAWVANALTALIAFAALVVFMAALYRFGPSRESPRWTWITPGAVIAGVLIVIVSAAFTFYVANFGSYNETYGSLGAIIGFLTWLWLVMIVLIMGGEINSEMEHQTARDTTTGPARPMGRRGAVMADRVGQTYEEKSAEPAKAGSGPPRRDGSDPHGAGGARGDGGDRGGAGGTRALAGADTATPRSSNQKMAGAALLVGLIGVALASRNR